MGRSNVGPLVLAREHCCWAIAPWARPSTMNFLVNGTVAMIAWEFFPFHCCVQKEVLLKWYISPSCMCFKVVYVVFFFLITFFKSLHWTVILYIWIASNFSELMLFWMSRFQKLPSYLPREPNIFQKEKGGGSMFLAGIFHKLASSMEFLSFPWLWLSHSFYM